jgi:hypothetical protein
MPGKMLSTRLTLPRPCARGRRSRVGLVAIAVLLHQSAVATHSIWTRLARERAAVVPERIFVAGRGRVVTAHALLPPPSRVGQGAQLQCYDAVGLVLQ